MPPGLVATPEYAAGIVQDGQLETRVRVREAGVVQDALPGRGCRVQRSPVAGAPVALFGFLGLANVIAKRRRHVRSAAAHDRSGSLQLCAQVGPVGQRAFDIVRRIDLDTGRGQLGQGFIKNLADLRWKRLPLLGSF